MSRARIAAALAGLTAIILTAFPSAAFSQGNIDELANASIENLMNMQVSSVSRRQEALRSTSAAVFVITSEDIRRSGITDIAELFRMVPGMSVAQSNSSTWAISSRGFNSQYAKMLLVAIDGRSVYDPITSGVYWNLQNLVLEDIDRIEIIRGPGATMWGSNAVNGVINIITKKAADTKGGLLVVDAGQGRPGEGAFRFGQSIGTNAFYRVSGRQTTRSSLLNKSGSNGGDSWNATNVDSRLDWNPSPKDAFTFELGVYRGVGGSSQNILQSLSPLIFAPAGLLSTNGSHGLGRWTRSLGPASNLAVQFYFNSDNRTGFGNKNTNTADFDFQHNFRLGGRHNIMWGAGRRETLNRSTEMLSYGILPDRANFNLSSAFVQDEFQVVQDKLIVTLGSKFERSSLTGSSVQPSLHVLWLPTTRQSLWAAASRAMRTTTIIERGLHVTLATFDAGFAPGIVELRGQPDTQSEELMAYEAGYRYQASRKIWIDLATFYNNYENLTAITPSASYLTSIPAPAHVVAPLSFRNVMRGETYGAELSANYRMSSLLTLRGGYSILRMQLHRDAGIAASVEGPEGENPRHQIQVASMLNLPKSFEVSSHAYFVSSLPTLLVPGYTRVDTNITWKGLERTELSLIGENLLGSHLEFGDTPAESNVIGRSIFGRLTWRF